jgi:hypothetical protein
VTFIEDRVQKTKMLYGYCTEKYEIIIWTCFVRSLEYSGKRRLRTRYAPINTFQPYNKTSFLLIPKMTQ